MIHLLRHTMFSFPLFHLCIFHTYLYQHSLKMKCLTAWLNTNTIIKSLLHIKKKYLIHTLNSSILVFLFSSNTVCVTQTEVTLLTPESNTTESITICQKQTGDLPVLWAVIGYVAVGLTKIILCLSSIWVNKLLICIHCSDLFQVMKQNSQVSMFILIKTHNLRGWNMG